MTRIIATVCALASLLAGPSTALAAASPALDLGDLPIVGPVVTGLLDDDTDPTDPLPVDPVPVDPTDPLPTDPTGTDPTGTDPTGTDPTGTDPTGTGTTGTGTTGSDPGTSSGSGVSGTGTPASGTGTGTGTGTSGTTAVPSGTRRWVTGAPRATHSTGTTTPAAVSGTPSATATNTVGFPLLQPVAGQTLRFTAAPSEPGSSQRASDVAAAPRFDAGLALLIGLVFAAVVAFAARGMWRRSALR